MSFEKNCDYDDCEQSDGDEEISVKEEELNRDEFDYEQNKDMILLGLKTKAEKLEEQLKNNIKALNLNLKNELISIYEYNKEVIPLHSELANFQLREYNIDENNLVTVQILNELNKLFETYENNNEESFNGNEMNEIFMKYYEILEEFKYVNNTDIKYESRNILSIVSDIVDIKMKNKYSAELKNLIVNEQNLEKFITDYINIERESLFYNLENFKYDVFYDEYVECVDNKIKNLLRVKYEEYEEQSIKEVAEQISLEFESIIKLCAKNFKNRTKKEFEQFEYNEIKKTINKLSLVYELDSEGNLQKKFKFEEIVNDFSDESKKYLNDKYGNFIKTSLFSPDSVEILTIDEQAPSVIQQLKNEYEDDKNGIPRRIFADDEIDDDFSDLSNIEYLREKYEKYVKDSSFFGAAKLLNYFNKKPANKKMNKAYQKKMLIINSIVNLVRHEPNFIITNKNVDYKRRENIVKNILHNCAVKFEVKFPKTKDEQFYSDFINNSFIRSTKIPLSERDLILLAENIKNIPDNLEPLNITIFNLKIQTNKHIIKWLKVVLNINEENLTMSEKLLDDFITKNKSVMENKMRIEKTSISQQINMIKKTYYDNQILKYYDEAVDKFNSLSSKEKNKVSSVIKNIVNEKEFKEFLNGVPDKGPLIYEFPPILPEDDDGDAAFDKYQNNKNYYYKKIEENPSIYPYIKNKEYPKTNYLIEQVEIYDSFNVAINSTPMNGFFKIGDNVEIRKEVNSMIVTKMSTDDINKFVKRYTIVEKDEFGQIVSVIVPTIYDVMMKFKTFKKVPSDERSDNGLYVFAEKIKNNCKIVMISQKGGLHSCWIEHDENAFYFISTFNEYMFKMREKFIKKYEDHRNIGILSKNEVNLCKHLYKRIKAISIYLNQQINDNVQIKEIIQDHDLKHRLQKRNEIYEDIVKLFKFEENSTKQLNKLVFIIENKIHKLFTDIYKRGSAAKNYDGILTNGNINIFNKMSELYDSKFLDDILYGSSEDTEEYDFYIATAVLKIYMSGAMESIINEDIILIDDIIFKNFAHSTNDNNKIKNHDRFLAIKKLNFKLSKKKSFSIEKSLHAFSKHTQSYNMLLNYVENEDLSNSDEKDITAMYMINSIKETYSKNDKNNYWENYLKDYQNYVKNLVKNFTPKFLDIINDVSKEVEEKIKIIKKNDTTQIIEEENYVPTPISEKQLELMKNNAFLKINENFSNRGNKLSDEDLNSLANVEYDQLLKIYDNLREKPEIFTHIPIQYAKRGVNVLYTQNPIRFIVEGTFPEFEIVYRYKNEDNIVCTELENICEWIGVNYVPEKLPNNIFGKVTSYERGLMEHIHTFKTSRFLLLLDKKGDIINFENVSEKIINVKSRNTKTKIVFSKITVPEKFKEIEKLIMSGLKKTKKYQEEFKYKYIVYLLFGNVEKNDLKELIKIRPTVGQISGTKQDKISKIYNKFTNETLTRKITKSDGVKYPVPMYYNQHNFPVFSRAHKKILEYLLNGELLSPTLLNKINVHYVNEISQEEYKKCSEKIYELNEVLKIKQKEMHEIIRLCEKENNEILEIIEKKHANLLKLKIIENNNKIKPKQENKNKDILKLKFQEHNDLVKDIQEAINLKITSKKTSLLNLKKQEYRDLIHEHSKLEYERSRYNKLIFEGSVPFVIDENSDNYDESIYYVEQVYKDKKYGLPIIFRIGVDIEKVIAGCVRVETHDEIVRKYNINVELELNNRYFKNIMNEQTEIDYFELKKLENYSINKTNILTNGAYSMLDSHDFLNDELKYDPADVWEWDPLKDYKSNAKSDVNIWNDEKHFILTELKKSLKEEGVSSSAFIGFKNDCTKYLQKYRLNLPTQLYRKFRVRQHKPMPMKERSIKYITNKEEFLYLETIQKMIKFGLINIDEKAVDIILNLKKYFQNYKTFSIIYEYSIIDNVRHDGLLNVENTTYNPYEILYGTLMNMSNNINLVYSEKIIEYVKNIELLDELDSEDYSKIVFKHPILKIIYILSKDNKKIDLWNILNCVLDKWYKQKYETEEIKKENITKYIIHPVGKLIKYTFNSPIVITPEDVLNYIGDSHYKNYMYNKGFRNVDVSANTNVMHILTPGGKFEAQGKNIENNKFVKKITIPREMTDSVPIYMNIMVISDDELHKQYGITNNSARRCALVYNVDLGNVEPYFGTANVLTTINKKMNYALNKDDILKYLEKKGNAYTILEMSDAEIEERRKLKLINEKYLYLRDIQFNYYKGALIKYYSSNNSKKTMKNLLIDSVQGLRVNNKHLVKLDNNTLLKYRDAIDEAIEKKKIRKNKGDIEKYISMLSIFPDFVYGEWYSREKYVNDNFEKNFGITVEHFLGNKKREIDMTIDIPKEFLDMNKVVDLPF